MADFAVGGLLDSEDKGGLAKEQGHETASQEEAPPGDPSHPPSLTLIPVNCLTLHTIIPPALFS